MSLTVALALAFFGTAVVLYFWNTIKDTYVRLFSPWIKEKCGERIGKLCDDLFEAADNRVRFVRRNLKELFDVIYKYDVTCTKKSPETTEIRETVVVRQSDGSYVQKDVTETVSNDDLPFEVTKEVLTKGGCRFDNKKELLERIVLED